MKPLVIAVLSLALHISGQCYAQSNPGGFNKAFRIEVGAFDGRIARSQSGNTIPFNTNDGQFYSAEAGIGSPAWHLIVGGNYSIYKAKVASSTSASKSTITYGGMDAGVSYSTPHTEWRLIYAHNQVPYTDAPDPTTLIPHVISADYLRFQLITRATAPDYTLSLLYYLNVPVNNPKLSDGSGVMKTNYYLGGCARLMFGTRWRMGPAICLELNDSNLPNAVTVHRQEVHGRWTVEF